MRSLINICFLLSLPVFLIAQNTLFDKPVKQKLDSIRLVLRQTNNDTLRMSAFRDLHFYYSEMDRDTALYFAEQQLILSQKLNQKLWEASAYESIGYVTQIEGNYPKAFVALSNALKIAEDANSEKGNWNLKKFAKDGDAHKTRYYNLTAIHILFAFLNLGTGNNQKAFESFQKGINTAEIVKDSVGLIAAYANFGNTCLRFNKLDSAILLTNKAIVYLNNSDLHITNPPYFNFEKGNCLNTLSLIYSQKRDFKIAKQYLKEAENLCQDENSRDALVNIYISMAHVYRNNNQLDSSLYYAQKCLNTARLLGTTAAINNAYTAITESYKMQGNTAEAFKYLELSKSLNDSINNSRQEKLNQYQNLNLKEQVRLIEAEKESLLLQNNIRTYAMLAGLGVFILIAFIFYRNNRIRAKINQKLEILNLDLAHKNTLLDKRNAQNELLLKEIHHRVKNNLEIISSLLALESAHIDDPSVQGLMQESQNRVHSMGIIHQKLYQGENLASIEMRDYFINLGENILDSFNSDGRIKIECNMPKLILDVDTAISIGLITNELITNSLKYAFTEKRYGEIKVSLTEEQNEGNTEGGLLLKISDDGIGKPKVNKSKGTGFGTQLIALLTKQLDGQLNYEINHGTVVSLAFKKPKIG
jgi:two-component sensor histidine kinase